MFSYDNSTSSHGATKGSISDTLLERFSGTEGPEIANKISAEIKIALVKMDALNFLTAPLKDILAEIPTPESGGDIFKAFQLKKTFTTEWTKAYWTVRGFFKTGSPAAEQMKLFDESADLPELWKTFNTNYVASANFSGIFSLFYQLTGQNHVQKNLLAEFISQNDLQKYRAILKCYLRLQ